MQPAFGLEVTLATQALDSGAQSPFILPITVSIHNAASSPVTVLKWGTPLDPRAGVLGVFEVCKTGSGQILAPETIKISRKLPPSAEDLVEIAAGQRLDRTVTLPGLHLETGHEYSVQARGIWHAIWEKPLADVTASQLEDFGGAERGSFESNLAIVDIK